MHLKFWTPTKNTTSLQTSSAMFRSAVNCWTDSTVFLVSFIFLVPGQLSLAIPSWVGAVNTSESWDVYKRCTSPVSVPTETVRLLDLHNAPCIRSTLYTPPCTTVTYITSASALCCDNDSTTLNDVYAAISTENNYTAAASKQPTMLTTTTMQTALVCDWQVFKALDSLRPTAAGLDGLPAWFLRVAAPVFCQLIAFLDIIVT